MRLLNTTTFILEEFTGNDIPKYAILSHRWGRQEITFQDIQHFKNFRDYFKTRKSTKSEGWSKIKHSCEQAVLDGLQWIWVDSCCIDKMSSAELSEAINSMFNWYRKAQVCYAYLSDVFIPSSEDSDRASYEFRNSRWFRRGWTLQELLAPRKLLFFSRYWVELGTRKDLWYLVSKATGIKDEVGWEVASVAQKLSWASKRETTRSEDRAYSLMGLFGVNMPPLYGEGENAFIRLQLEILRTSDDESIFAWRDAENISGGLLARSPDAFQQSGDIQRFDSIHYEKPPYSMTNKGLSMEFSLVTASSQQNSIFDADDTYLAPLQCRYGNDYSMLAILLRCIRGNQYRRISSGELILLPAWNHQMLSQIARRRVVQVKQEDDFERSFLGFYQYKFSVASNILSLKGFEVTDRYTSASSHGGIDWDERAADAQRILIGHVEEEGVTAALEFTKIVEDASASRETFSETGSAELEFAEAEAETQFARAATADAEADRFIAIFNIYATRARLGILIPKRDEKIQALLERLFKYHQKGDWMTAGQDRFPEPKLMSGSRITAQLIRNQNELGLRSYEAEISFEEAVELPNNEILPYQVLPRLPELENNEITSMDRRKLISVDADPSISHHVSSFLLHKDLEKERQKHEYNERENYQAPNDTEAAAQSQPPSPSQSTQLESERTRRPSVSPVLPDLHRMSSFGIDLLSLSKPEEQAPPLPLPRVSESTFTFTNINPFVSKDSSAGRPLSLSDRSIVSQASDREDEDQEKDDKEDDDQEEDDLDDLRKEDQEEDSDNEEKANEDNHENNAQKELSGGDTYQNQTHRKERVKRKSKKARRAERKGKGVQK